MDIEKKNMLKFFAANDLSLKRLLETLFKQNIRKLTYLGNSRLNKMPEYEFCLLIFNVIFEDCSNYCVYIKIANEDQVEESLFCYWLFCEEKFKLNMQFCTPENNIVICKNRYYETKYELRILDKNKKYYRNTLVDFIDIYKYKISNLKQIKRNSLEQTNKFLFVAIM